MGLAVWLLAGTPTNGPRSPAAPRRVDRAVEECAALRTGDPSRQPRRDPRRRGARCRGSGRARWSRCTWRRRTGTRRPTTIPTVFDVARRPRTRNSQFGIGRHHCVGAALGAHGDPGGRAARSPRGGVTEHRPESAPGDRESCVTAVEAGRRLRRAAASSSTLRTRADVYGSRRAVAVPLTTVVPSWLTVVIDTSA